MAELIYIADPMCSWCWAFAPILNTARETLPDGVPLRYVMGGLAPDSDAPMPESMQQRLQATWRHIAKQTGTEFNFEFWSKCRPRRSTYPACRAVLAAAEQGRGEAMFAAIQRAYYLEARNPSDEATLVQLATSLNMTDAQFESDLRSEQTQSHLERDLNQAAWLGAAGFPTLVLVGEQTWMIAPGYLSAEAVQKRLSDALAKV